MWQTIILCQMNTINWIFYSIKFRETITHEFKWYDNFRWTAIFECVIFILIFLLSEIRVILVKIDRAGYIYVGGVFRSILVPNREIIGS